MTSTTPIGDLPNVGPKVARTLAELGITTREALEAVGPVEVYRRVRAHLGHPPPRRFYLHGLEAALLGIPVRDLPVRRRAALARLALDLGPAGPPADVRPRRTVRAREGRRRYQRRP